MNESLLELVRREEIVFKMISGIRLDLDKVRISIFNIDEILTRILRIEENESDAHIKSIQDGR